jgi:hypothetical protein
MKTILIKEIVPYNVDYDNKTVITPSGDILHFQKKSDIAKYFNISRQELFNKLNPKNK